MVCQFRGFNKIVSCPSVRPSVRMEILGSHWTDSYENWYLSTVRMSVDKIQVPLTFKAYWLLYVPYSGHYTYRTVVTIRNVQWSLYVPYSGHYMYRTVVTIRYVQWSLYVPYSGHYTYRTVVTIRTVRR